MRKRLASWFGAAVVSVMALSAGDAHALLIENGPLEDELGADVEFTYHYPYATTLTFVDPGYAFDDDPLMALANEPYRMPVIIKRLAVRRVMVAPRTTFVKEMVVSADLL